MSGIFLDKEVANQAVNVRFHVLVAENVLREEEQVGRAPPLNFLAGSPPLRRTVKIRTKRNRPEIPVLEH